MTRWVVDASPLIFLAKLDRLALLRQGDGEVYVPPKVLAEIRAQRDSSASSIDRAVESWLRIQAPRREASAFTTGEAAVIELARDLDADRVVLDDGRVRRVSRSSAPSVSSLPRAFVARSPTFRARSSAFGCTVSGQVTSW